MRGGSAEGRGAAAICTGFTNLPNRILGGVGSCWGQKEGCAHLVLSPPRQSVIRRHSEMHRKKKNNCSKCTAITAARKPAASAPEKKAKKKKKRENPKLRDCDIH